ncbi:MAG: hypothetical protein A2787_04190 [Omnitrophica WOR_2 bacterium RIFCSPHIGHO2_01_FULL_48_9]|nr:MAG: hypothetical protein A3D10_07410 [Omnitrophica WOR_2 bacterium RIFCSPHIGHO2_02_FULL_48_11]OGX34184.1 MAG: hypothetical protein A2787_04190 [Omnitrophica WOR_2 bacterium RIFCSPHIGHO2_01_FULL_48_9]
MKIRTVFFAQALFAMLDIIRPAGALACKACFGAADSKLTTGVVGGILTLLVVLTVVIGLFIQFFISFRKRSKLMQKFS